MDSPVRNVCVCVCALLEAKLISRHTKVKMNTAVVHGLHLLFFYQKIDFFNLIVYPLKIVEL